MLLWSPFEVHWWSVTCINGTGFDSLCMHNVSSFGFCLLLVRLLVRAAIGVSCGGTGFVPFCVQNVFSVHFSFVTFEIVSQCCSWGFL